MNNSEYEVRVFFTDQRHRQTEAGIHLIDPTERELQDGIQRALEQGFATVWVHYQAV